MFWIKLYYLLGTIMSLDFRQGLIDTIQETRIAMAEREQGIKQERMNIETLKASCEETKKRHHRTAIFNIENTATLKLNINKAAKSL